MSFVFAASFCTVAFCAGPDAIDNSFTYQGRLLLDAVPANVPIDRLTFNIYDAASGGSIVGGSPVSATNSSDYVTDGLFAAKLDFGDVFSDGQKRWIEVTYTDPANPSEPVVFPLQEMTAAPQASFAIRSAEADKTGTWTGATVGSAADGRSALELSTTSTPTFSGVTLGGTTGTPFVVDTSAFVVNAANNQVGVNTASPAYTLDVNGDIHATTNKGVALNDVNRPLITRAYDAFTSGDYSGLGRWGLFMEPQRLTLGFPDVSSKGLDVVSYNANSTVATRLFTVLQSGFVGVNNSSPSKALDVVGDMIRLQPAYSGGGSWNYLQILSGASGQSRIEMGPASNPTKGEIWHNNGSGDWQLGITTNGTLRELMNDYGVTILQGLGDYVSPYKGSMVAARSGSSGGPNFSVMSNAFWDGAHFTYGHTSSTDYPLWSMTLDAGAYDQVSFYRGEPGDAGTDMDPAKLKEKLRLDNTGSLYFFADDDHVASDDDTATDRAKIYASKVSGNAVLFAKDWTGTRSQLSSHADPRTFALTTASKSAQTSDTLETSFSDPEVTIPWSFHHSNELIGKGAVVDMSKVVSWVQEKMVEERGEEGGRAIYVYDLPEDSVVSEDDYLNRAAETSLTDAIRKLGSIEVPLGADGSIPTEAWEEVAVIEQREQTETVTEKKIDWVTAKVIEEQHQITRKVSVATGANERRLKEGYTFVDGKIYRPAIADDVDVSTIPNFEVPDWVSERVDANKSLKAKKTSQSFRDRLQRQVALMRLKPASLGAPAPDAVAMGKK